MTRPKRPWKPNRRERRVLLVLLSGAANLNGIAICRAAQVRTGTIHPLLARLEQRGWAVSEWDGPAVPGLGRRRVYSLTRKGRLCALALLGLEERRD